MVKKKVAILFFGLSRSLHKTIESIKQNLLTVLKENAFEYDIFVHTYKINGPYHNDWSHEHTENYQNEDVEGLLQPTYYLSDDQKEIENSINFNEYYTNLGNFGGHQTEEMTKYLIKNMCLALYSKKKITQLFETKKNEYDYAIITRPDLLLQNKINCGLFDAANETNIIIPAIDNFMGANDRFCVGKPDTILYYGTLFDTLKEYSEKKSIISERYLLDKLNEKNINILKGDIQYLTVRM